MYALRVSGAVNTQGFVCKFFCAVYKFSFIHFFILFLDSYQQIDAQTIIK